MTDPIGSDRYYGKYRGKVVENEDVAGLGQLQVSVPDVLGEAALWAMPSVPYAGPGVGFFFLPPTGANVWVEFEAGDPQFPVWSGCFWGQAEVPASPAEEAVKVLKTDIFALRIDTRGGRKEVAITVDVGTPEAPKVLALTLTPEGIAINNDGRTIVELTAETVQLSSGASSQATIGTGLVELKNGQNTVAVAAESIDLKQGPAEITLSATGVALKNGFPSVSLSAQSVSINDGALEVT